MIELPEGTSAANAEHELLDFGFFQRGALGGSTSRIDRKGNRYRVAMSYGPFPSDQARLFVSRLISAKAEGIRIDYPLTYDQSGSGSPVVDGAGQAGTTLNLRGLIPGYVCREGFMLSIENENGRHYLHNVRGDVMADASGNMTITINPELRHPFLDGATVHLSKPKIEGFVEGDTWAWSTSVNHVVPIEFTLEEYE